MSQFDEYSGSPSARAHKMSAESFVAALAANVGNMSAEALKAYVINTLPLVGHLTAARAAGGHDVHGQFGDH